MKICYLTYNMNSKSGWGRYASDLISGVKKAGHEVVILKEEDDGFEGIPFLKRGTRIFSSALKTRRFIKNCDLVHALDGYPYGVIGAIANIGINKKLIITGVGTYAVSPLYNSSTTFLLKWAYKKANKVSAISNYTKQEILKKIDLSIDVVQPGIEVPFLSTDAGRRENFILSVGALKYRKGFHISIPAFALAKKKIPDLKYKIVGSQRDKDYFTKLKQIAREQRIENDIEFLSNISDEELKNLYKNASLFILTSVNHGHHFEGFGLVFLEAAAAGLPCIGTLGNGIEDSVKDGYNGILVPQNDVDKTAEALVDLLKNESKYSGMSRNSILWAQEHNLKNMVDKYLKIYSSL